MSDSSLQSSFAEGSLCPMDPTNAMVQRMPSLRLELGIHRLALMHFFFFLCGTWRVDCGLSDLCSSHCMGAVQICSSLPEPKCDFLVRDRRRLEERNKACFLCFTLGFLVFCSCPVLVSCRADCQRWSLLLEPGFEGDCLCWMLAFVLAQPL